MPQASELNTSKCTKEKVRIPTVGGLKTSCVGLKSWAKTYEPMYIAWATRTDLYYVFCSRLASLQVVHVRRLQLAN